MKHYIHIKSGHSYHVVDEIIIKDTNGVWVKGIQYQADYDLKDCHNNFACTTESFNRRFADPDFQDMPKELWHQNGTVSHISGHNYRRNKDGKEFVIWRNLKGDWIDASGKSKVPFNSPDDLPF